MTSTYEITDEERDKVLKTYIKEGKLVTFPSKEKRKYIILEYLIERFEFEKVYSEKDINGVLKEFYFDFATLRRYLIDYRFLERSRDGREYRVKNKK